MGYKVHRIIQFLFCHNLIGTEPGNHFDILLRQNIIDSDVSPYGRWIKRFSKVGSKVSQQRQSSNFLNSLLLPNGASLSGE